MLKNDIKIIAIINYNQKNYGIYQRNENIEYAIIHNGKFEFKLESKEKEILDKCYNLIRYNSNYSIYCGNYKIKQKEFEIYQDTRSKLYTFVLKKNNKRYIPEKEDTILLNTYFNDEKFVYYASKQQNNKKTKAMLKMYISLPFLLIVPPAYLYCIFSFRDFQPLFHKIFIS